MKSSTWELEAGRRVNTYLVHLLLPPTRPTGFLRSQVGLPKKNMLPCLGAQSGEQAAERVCAEEIQLSISKKPRLQGNTAGGEEIC